MTTISIREFEENIDRMFERVEDGEVIEVMRHGRVVAKVVPVDHGPIDTDPDETWARLSAMARDKNSDLPGPGVR